MKFLLLFIAWCILLVLSWPIAVIALVLAPLLWLLSLPFRLVAMCIGALVARFKSVLFLPARLLGHRG